MTLVVLIVAIVIGTITFVTLACIWGGTTYSLRKHGYDPNQTKETYNQLKSDLERISADLEEIREHVLDLVIMDYDRTRRGRTSHGG